MADEGSLGSVLAALFGGGPWGVASKPPPLASLPGAAPMAVPLASLPDYGKVPSPDFTAPPPGLRPRASDEFVPNLGAAKSIAAGAVEPFGQLGRVMTGQSQDIPMDLAGAAVGLTPAGRAGKVLKAGAGAAEGALEKGVLKAADEGRIGFQSSGATRGASSGTATKAPITETAEEAAARKAQMKAQFDKLVGSSAAPKPKAATDPSAGRIGFNSLGTEKTGTLSDFITAYHGSPHDFDRFDLSKIGTGEGAQAYGHGLYFAENEGVAKTYKGTVPNGLGPLNIRNLWTPAELPSGKGHMYQVAINAPPEHFLDWDKPLSEQHPEVIKKLEQRGLTSDLDKISPRNESNVEHLIGYLKRGLDDRAPVRSEGEATKLLHEAGIPGIKYLDQGSRNTVARPELVTNSDGTQQWATKSATGVLRRFSSKDAADKFWQSAEDKGRTRNFVLFDDKLVDILKKYGIAGIGALPAMNAYHYQDKQ